MYDNLENDIADLVKTDKRKIGSSIILALLTIFCIAAFVFLIAKSMQVKNKTAPINLENNVDDVGDKNFENKVEIDGLDTNFYDLIDDGSNKSASDDEKITINEDNYNGDEDLESKINELFEIGVANNENFKQEVEISDNIKNVYVNENSDNERDKNVIVNNKKGIKVQVGALKTNDFAIEYKNNLVSKYNNLFKDLEFFIKKVDLMEKGIFYRVQFGVFKDKKEAKQFCEKYIKISNNKLSSCIVVDD